MEIADLLNNSSTTANNNLSVSEMAREDGALGKDSFLELLVTELKYQDPLNPMDNKESIAQLAQFSALEQMQNLNKAFTEFSNTFGAGAGRAQSLNVLGMKATGLDSTGQLASGLVTRVSFNDGETMVTLAGGQTLDFSTLTSVEVPYDA